MKWRWILLSGAALVLLGACAAPAEPAGDENGALIYYLASEEEARGNDRIRARREKLNLPEGASVQESAEAVIRRILDGPSEGNMAGPVPEGVELLGLELRDQTAYVDFSEQFRDLSKVELVLADYCLTLSLTALDGIQAVVITSQGRSVGLQPKHIFYERDVLLSDMGDVLQTVEAGLYFLNSDGNLVQERRMLSLFEGQTIAETLVAALLEGPESRELIRVIPEGFTVNYVRVDNNICYVSLPAASLEMLPVDEQVQRLILWSLTESLYSIESIEEIRLLADGEELEYFGVVPVSDATIRPQG